MFLRRFSQTFGSLLILSLPAQAVADHHEVGEVEAAVRGFYGELAAAQFDKAFGRMQLGARGYVAFGVINEITTEEVRQRAIKQYQANFEPGALSLSPRYLKVTMHGTTAIATCLAQGEIQGPHDDEPRAVLHRVSLIWAKTDAGWKLVHWHASSVETSPDDD